MSKKNAARISMIASFYALMAVLGQAYAKKEYGRKAKQGNGVHSHRTSRNPGAFGGPKRSGIKLIRKVMRAGGKK